MRVASIFLGRPVASPNPPCLAGHGHPQPSEGAVPTLPATVQSLRVNYRGLAPS